LAACGAPATTGGETTGGETTGGETTGGETGGGAAAEFHSDDPTTFVEATIGDIDTFDPALAYDTASGEVIQNVYETLVFYDGEATDTFKPLLAESWELSDDGTVYTFHILGCEIP
jgi:peptide/nickel transport system substrate-binding protein